MQIAQTGDPSSNPFGAVLSGDLSDPFCKDVDGAPEPIRARRHNPPSSVDSKTVARSRSCR